MRYSLPTYLLVITLLEVTGCTESPEVEPLEKAARLSQQAETELGKSDYKNAERHFAESIELYSSAGDNAKLAEQYASLASVQTLAGKFPSALQSLTSLRTLYNQVADRNAEVNTMIEMARLHSRLHNTRESVRLLEEAYLSGQLYQLRKQFAISALQLGEHYSSHDQHTRAFQYFSTASAQFMQQADTAYCVESIVAAMSSLLQRGNTVSALQYFAQCELLLSTNRTSVDVAHAYALCGIAFMKSGTWELAVRSFEQSLALQQRSGIRQPQSGFLPLFGLGEVLYRNYSFDDAQRSFVNAYRSAREHAPPLVQAYLLVRIADCEVRKNTISYTQERSIRASQLYEHAQTVCSRAGYGFGEAIILHRFGTLKEISGDEFSAVTYYKRAFDKFGSSDLNPVPGNPAVDFGELMTPSNSESVEESFSSPLISLLLRNMKYADAAEYAERARAFSLQRIVLADEVHFKDPKKQQLFADARTARDRLTVSQRELFYFAKNGDNDHATRLQQQLMQSKNGLAAAVHALTQTYPAFNVLRENTHIGNITTAYLPQSVTALRYYFSGNEAWVFVIKKNETVTGIKLSSFGLELRKKMNRFITLLSRPVQAGFELNQLANELYTFLIQPVERYGAQRFLIIPPEGLAKFPFHALTKNGRPLIELTEVSYLPSLYLLRENRPLPQFITNVVAAGFSPDARWGLEFELRDVRSFFKNAQVLVNQKATMEALGSVKGELLHIASLFSSTQDGEHSLTLSDGTPVVMGTGVPITRLSALSPFPFVYVADINSKSNSITTDHSVLLLLNGTQSLVLNELPITPKVSRAFNEGLYSSYASTFSPYGSYREAMMQLNRKKDLSGGFASAAYFYYGL